MTGDRLSHSMRRLGMALGLAMGVAAISDVGAIAWAEAMPDRLLLAQQVVDGLPPPPALPPAQLAPEIQPAPISPSPSVVAPAPSTLPAPQNPEFATPQPTPYSTTEMYAVVVNGDSPLLLDQVRKIESGAFVQDYEGRSVIQAGLFQDPDRANQQVSALEAQGIGAEIVPVERAVASSTIAAQPDSFTSPELLPAAPVAREVTFGQDPTFPTTSPFADELTLAQTPLAPELPDRAYYVVVPGRSMALRDISLRITQLTGGLDVEEQNIQERESPLGPHVIVGPFVSRSAAFRWNRYFRAFGLPDSRVYFRR